MKRFFAILAGLIVLGAAASAQPRAIGARLGWGYELSFQYGFGEYQFLQVDLGATVDKYLLPDGARLTGTYNFIFSEPRWTSRGEWAWFAGVGATVGIIHRPEWVYSDSEQQWVKTAEYNYFMTGVVPQFGLEYTFWFPLQLSLDIRPTIGVALGKGREMGPFYMDGITFGFIPTLSVRYRF